MNWRGVGTWVLVVVAMLALVASAHDDDDDDDVADDLVFTPNVWITAPSNSSILVRESSFEVRGGSLWSDSIEIGIDGTNVGRASVTGGGSWRFPADQFELAPGLHDIRVTAAGAGGTSERHLWVFYEPDPGITFRLELVPDEATYSPGDLEATDPRLLILGPSLGLGVELSVDAPSEVGASIPSFVATGGFANLDVEVVDAVPGVYRIVVRGEDRDGAVAEATHTVTISGSSPGSEGPAIGSSSLSCTAGGFTTTLTTTAIAVFDNGFGEIEAVVDGGAGDEPVFSLAENSTIEAMTLVRSLADASTAGGFDVFVERTGEDTFPLGEHEVTLVTTVGAESCGIPIVLEVVQYSGG